jgi:hypothetical protein
MWITAAGSTGTKAMRSMSWTTESNPAEVEEAMLDSNRLKDDARNVAGEA